MFEGFSDSEFKILVELPFRVGMWVSRADAAGGHDADDAERQAIDAIVVAYAEDYLKSEFVQRLMEQAVSRQDEWDTWTSDLDRVPQECADAMKMLHGRILDRDLEMFKHNLMEIALAVAMAFREDDAPVRAGAYAGLVSFLTGFFPARTEEGDNISQKEQAALSVLASSMGLPQDVMRVL